MRSWLGEVALLLVLGCGGDPVAQDAPLPTPPAAPPRRQPPVALRDLTDVPPEVRRAFESHPEDFSALPDPGPNDWLSTHAESPQSVGNYWIGGPNRP